MDSHTLLIASSTASCWMAITLAGMYCRKRSDPALRMWLGAGLAMAIHGLVGLTPMHHALGDVATVMRDVSLTLAHLFLWLGYLHWQACASASQRVLLTGTCVVAVQVAVSLMPNSDVRNAVQFWVLAGIDLLLLRALIRSRRLSLSSPDGVLAAVTAAHMLALLVRGAALAMGNGLSDETMWAPLCDLLFSLAVPTLLVWVVVQREQELLRRAAESDSLTGWFNRHSLERTMAQEFQRSRRTGSGFQVLVFDIDHFKSINDRYGHAVGDQAIAHVTRQVSEVSRDYDLKFRLGGEEFMLFAPTEQVCALAERVRRSVETSPMLCADGSPIKITISVGHSGLEPDDQQWTDVLHRADEALFQAKAQGRNCVWRSDRGAEIKARGLTRALA